MLGRGFQKRGEFSRILQGIVLPALMGVLGGCGGGPVPDEVNLELPDGTQRKVSLGDGVPLLSESAWKFCPTPVIAGQTLCLQVRFDENGSVTCIDSPDLCSIFPTCQACADGKRRSTTQDGMTYVAGTYGAETRDGQGMAVAGRAALFLGGFEAGSIEAHAQAMRDLEEDTFSGTAWYSIKVSVPFVDIPSEYLNQTIDFVAVRAEE